MVYMLKRSNLELRKIISILSEWNGQGGNMLVQDVFSCEMDGEEWIEPGM